MSRVISLDTTLGIMIAELHATFSRGYIKQIIQLRRDYGLVYVAQGKHEATYPFFLYGATKMSYLGRLREIYVSVKLTHNEIKQLSQNLCTVCQSAYRNNLKGPFGDLLVCDATTAHHIQKTLNSKVPVQIIDYQFLWDSHHRLKEAGKI